MRSALPGAAARRGYSLIELLVTLAIVGIVLAAAGSLLLQAYANEAAYRQQNGAQQNARAAADMVADDMKGAKRVTSVVTIGGQQATLPTGTVQGAGLGATATTPRWSTPLFFNVYDDLGAERRVRYWLEGTNLRRQIVAYVSETATPGAATAETAGTVVARNVRVFTARKPGVNTAGSTSLADYNHSIVRLSVQVVEGDAASEADPRNSRSAVQADVTLRNNLF
jgi:prepilin-type N-terminal cleavage/methylation domain-containing protein